ncbi:hypothetical protein DFH09DRAFT_1333325 [Mycena vulgaris]|nr:hypothetical protein DFH09DRAFT_1333325 [Mycena vulgaris]
MLVSHLLRYTGVRNPTCEGTADSRIRRAQTMGYAGRSCAMSVSPLTLIHARIHTGRAVAAGAQLSNGDARCGSGAEDMSMPSVTVPLAGCSAVFGPSSSSPADAAFPQATKMVTPVWRPWKAGAVQESGDALHTRRPFPIPGKRPIEDRYFSSSVQRRLDNCSRGHDEADLRLWTASYPPDALLLRILPATDSHAASFTHTRDPPHNLRALGLSVRPFKTAPARVWVASVVDVARALDAPRVE